MAVLKIWFENLDEDSRQNLRRQVEKDLLDDKESDWESDWEDIYGVMLPENPDYIDEDDYVDQKRDEYIEKYQDQEVDDYINKNDDGRDFII